MIQQLPRDRLHATVALVAPPADILAERADQWEIVALFFGEEAAQKPEGFHVVGRCPRTRRRPCRCPLA